MNRKGSGEELALFMFLTIMVIFLAGVVLGTRSFFGQGYDFREAEKLQIESKIVSCFTSKDFFASGFSLANCGVNEDFFDSNHLILFRSSSDEKRVFVRGVADYENQCQLNRDGKRNRAYPICAFGSVYRGTEKFDYIIGTNQKAMQGVS